MSRRFAALFVLLFAFPAHALDNQLKQHPSPYLALHGSDPVAWQEWNAETVALARKEGKLLFVSIPAKRRGRCRATQDKAKDVA